MKLKKQLFGYSRKQTRKIIDDYEKRIDTLQDDNLYLKEKLVEVKFMYEEEKRFSRDKIALKTIDVMVKANEEYANYLEEVSKEQGKLYEKFYELVDMIGVFQIRLKEMETLRNRIADANEMTREALKDFIKTTQSFDEKTGRDEQSGEKIGFAEFLVNHAGEGSVVELLQLYVKLYNH